MLPVVGQVALVTDVQSKFAGRDSSACRDVHVGQFIGSGSPERGWQDHDICVERHVHLAVAKRVDCESCDLKHWPGFSRNPLLAIVVEHGRCAILKIEISQEFVAVSDPCLIR